MRQGQTIGTIIGTCEFSLDGLVWLGHIIKACLDTTSCLMHDTSKLNSEYQRIVLPSLKCSNLDLTPVEMEWR